MNLALYVLLINLAAISGPEEWLRQGALPARLSQTGLFVDLPALTPAPGLIPYEINLAFWSDGAGKQRWLRLPPGARITRGPQGTLSFPAGTVFVKHFERDGSRIETRLLVCGEEGKVLGASYQWRANKGEEAYLVQEGHVEQSASSKEASPWFYPGTQDCVKCHTAAAGGVLGAITAQLNRPSGRPESANQLLTWSHRGWLEPPLKEAEISGLPIYPRAEDAAEPLENRVRAWLAVNCAMCHRPGGAVADFDARYETPLAQQGLLGARARIDFGADHARIIAPGDVWRSILLRRVQVLDGAKMPPLAHEAIDRAGASLLMEWITALPAPPVVAPPEIVPPEGDYTGPVRVSLRARNTSAEIHFTTDGSSPGKNAPLYEGPITVTKSTTLRARAYRKGYTQSIAVAATYIIGK